MPQITISNEETGKSCVIFVSPSGIVSATAPRRTWKALGTPPGHQKAGPLGEVGPQLPPETPGTAYTFLSREDGSVLAVPKTVCTAKRKKVARG